MKFLFITDTHLTAKTPASRLDNFEVTTYKKLIEIGQLIKLHNIDFVIHGGDMFHTPKCSLRYSGIIAKILNSWGVPVYVVPGNHDIFGYNINTIDQTILGFYEKTDVVKLLTRDNPIEKDENGLKILFEAQEYYMDIDKGNPNDYKVDTTNADYNILITHSMLLPMKFFDGVPHTLIKDVNTDADLVLAGHYHNGFKEQFVNDTWFYNPGATIRVECSRKDKPKVIVFEIENKNNKAVMNSKYIELKTAKEQSEVFSIESKQEKKQAEQVVEEFKNNLVSLQSLQNADTVNDLVLTISNELSIEPTISKLALGYINKAEIDVDDNVSVSKEFKEKDYKLSFKKLTIDNFQSHVHTEIDFKDGLNTITGESNSGKTAILRAILWVLYNEPKGTDFIRTGASSCTVEIEFTDGSKIKRHRTLTSSGSYTVTNKDGDESTFKGFGSEIPIEVVNEHQMPIVNLSKDLKYKLNISSQLEPPFLLCDSPSARANAVGRLTGVQVVDDAIKICKSENLSKSKEVKFLEGNLKKHEDELKDDKYKDLASLNQYIILIEEVNKLIDSKALEINNLNSKLEKLNDLKLKEENINKVLKSIGDIESVKSLVDNAVEMYNKTESIIKLNDNLKVLRKSIDKHCDSLEYINYKLHLIDDISEATGKLESITDLTHYYNELQNIIKTQVSLESEINKLSNLNAISNIVELASSHIDILENCTTLNDNLINKNNEINSNISKIESINKRISIDEAKKNDLINEINEYVSKNNICPVCNSKIQIDTFIQEEI